VEEGMSVPVRRGTGPKARLRTFLAAYDAWIEHFLSKDGDDMSYEELCEADRLFGAMQDARNGISSFQGLGQAVMCEHEWVSAVNQVIKSGEICLKCMSVRV
jgi:hypothetical protein